MCGEFFDVRVVRDPNLRLPTLAGRFHNAGARGFEIFMRRAVVKRFVLRV